MLYSSYRRWTVRLNFVTLNVRSSDDFFIPESTNIFNYLRLHVFGRNASSPASEKSCNKGQMPDALVSDFVSLAGFMIAKDFPRLPHIVNNPHGIMDLHNIPLWFPIMHLAQDPSHLSVGGVAMNVLGSFLCVIGELVALFGSYLLLFY
jgi:hypothetical protein